MVSVLRVRANEKDIALEYRWESGVPEIDLRQTPAACGNCS